MGRQWKRSLRMALVLTFLLGGWPASSAFAAESITLELIAGDTTRDDSIVDIAVPSALRRHKHLLLTRLDTGGRVPVQVDRTSQPARLVWIARGRLVSGGTRRYRLTPASAAPPAAGVSVTDNGRQLSVKVGAKDVFVYNQATVPSPDPRHPYYARSGYIHPLYNPSGRVISDDFNPDHAHQHGIMLAWREMTFEGRSTNGWDQKSGLGKVEHIQVESSGGGPVFGSFTSRLQHVDLTAPGGPKPALSETWHVRVYAFESAFVFDITSNQRCASPHAVTIDKVRYGGLMIRGHADWHEHRNYDFLTGEGKSKANGNQTRPRWVDLFGPLDGTTTGATIMDHPDNFRFPQPVRLHPTMPYFCFAPSSIDSFTITPKKPLVSRYRFHIHDGAIEKDMADRLWYDFAYPAEVRVLQQ